jgi:hypothetical protein
LGEPSLPATAKGDPQQVPPLNAVLSAVQYRARTSGVSGLPLMLGKNDALFSLAQPAMQDAVSAFKFIAL